MHDGFSMKRLKFASFFLYINKQLNLHPVRVFASKYNKIEIFLCFTLVLICLDNDFVYPDESKKETSSLSGDWSDHNKPQPNKKKNSSLLPPAAAYLGLVKVGAVQQAQPLPGKKDDNFKKNLESRKIAFENSNFCCQTSILDVRLQTINPTFLSTVFHAQNSIRESRKQPRYQTRIQIDISQPVLRIHSHAK